MLSTFGARDGVTNSISAAHEQSAGRASSVARVEKNEVGEVVARENGFTPTQRGPAMRARVAENRTIQTVLPVTIVVLFYAVLP